jgi:hypothetical protein
VDRHPELDHTTKVQLAFDKESQPCTDNQVTKAESDANTIISPPQQITYVL